MVVNFVGSSRSEYQRQLSGASFTVAMDVRVELPRASLASSECLVVPPRTLVRQDA
jgi:hypothetical protein